MTKRYRSTGTRRTVRRRASFTSRPPSVRHAASSWGRGYSGRSHADWGSSGGSGDGIQTPLGTVIGFVMFGIIAAIMFCTATGGRSARPSYSPPSYSRSTATPVASAAVRAEVAGRWTVTITTTRPEEVSGHERQSDCEADEDCTLVADSCERAADPDTCRLEAIPGTCREVLTGYDTQEVNCRWEETGEGRWVDRNCRPDPADPDYEICDQEYQVEEEWVCDEERVPRYEERCDEREICGEAVFCDTIRVVQVEDQTLTQSGVGGEVSPPEYEVPEGGEYTEVRTFAVRIVRGDYDVALEPAPTTLDAYTRALNTVYYVLLDEDGEPLGHITAAELEAGNYPNPQR